VTALRAVPCYGDGADNGAAGCSIGKVSVGGSPGFGEEILDPAQRSIAAALIGSTHGE